jgi:hypothetical protein
VRIGANTYNATVATKVSDLGTGTMGVVKTATLLNSWVANSTGQEPQYYKDISGNVVITGAIKSGTTTYNTKLFSMGASYAAASGRTELFSQFANNGSGNVPGSISVDNVGDVYFLYGGNTVMTTTATFRSSNGNNSV